MTRRTYFVDLSNNMEVNVEAENNMEARKLVRALFSKAKNPPKILHVTSESPKERAAKKNPCNYKTLLKNPSRRYTAKQLSEIRKNFGTIKGIDPESTTYNDLIVLLDSMPQVQLKQLAAAKIKFISGLARNRVKRKRNPKMAKKKRSAKQLANDKRLGRMAKARAKKKRGGRRKKVVRKKNVHATRRRTIRTPGVRRKIRAPAKRTTRAKSHLWLVFKCKGKVVMYLAWAGAHLGWVKPKGKAVLFQTKEAAAQQSRMQAKGRFAKSWQVGSTSASTTSGEIRAACEAPAGKA